MGSITKGAEVIATLHPIDVGDEDRRLIAWALWLGDYKLLECWRFQDAAAYRDLVNEAIERVMGR